MENDFLNTQITFKDNDNELYIGEVREGTIFLSPVKNVDINQFGYQIVMEGRGRTSVIKKTQTQEVLLQNKTLYAGETYEFDFSVKGNLPGSYKGQNIKFNWSVETFIELEESTHSEIRTALIKGFKLFKAFNPNKVLAEKRDISIYQEPQPYSVIPSKETLKLSGCLHWVILLAGTILSFVFMEKFPSEANTILGSLMIGFLFIATVGTWLYKRMALGNIICEVGNLEGDQFMVLLQLSKNWKNINSIECNYNVIEKVVDDRGTSTTTHHANIYKSGLKQKENPNRNPRFIFDFPDKNLPASYQEGDVSFIWQVEIKAFLGFGLSSTFKKNITVKKE